ncbi:MAG: SDR family oxidoreductase [Candidatus Heimdallarchaeota archaeon]
MTDISATAVLITGAAGFIGSHLCSKLIKSEISVIGLDNLQTGRLINIHPLLQDPYFKFIHGDIRDLDHVNSIIQKEKIDMIFHQAALPSVPRSIEAPLSTHQANVDGTLNLLLASKNAKVKRFIYASSSSVYGSSEKNPKTEAMPTQPISPYAASKLAGEHYCKVFSTSYGLETVSLRYFNVFGPCQAISQYSGVISIFLDSMLMNRPYQIFGDGEQSRDFTYVDNVVEANILAAQVPDAAGETFNIACGERTTINILEKTLADICQIKDQKAKYSPSRKGDVRHSLADISKAREILNYSPSVRMREGLEQTKEWFSRQLAYNV